MFVFFPSNVERLRDFIKHVYVDRRYTGERSLEKPLRERMVYMVPLDIENFQYIEMAA